MKANRTFNVGAALKAAKDGSLRGAELREAITIAEEFGLSPVAKKLRRYLVESRGLAGKPSTTRRAQPKVNRSSTKIEVIKSEPELNPERHHIWRYGQWTKYRL